MRKISRAEIAGERHKDLHMECQDYADGYCDGDMAVIALSDGAGSKKYARETAKLLVGAIIGYFQEQGDLGSECLAGNIEEYVNKCIAEQGEYPVKEMGGTLLFAAMDSSRYLIGHMGDGVVIGKTEHGFLVLSRPENGEYVNKTYLFPTNGETGHFRTLAGTLAEDYCFILASDGISESLYDAGSGAVSKACGQIDIWNRTYDEKRCSKILADNLRGVFAKYNNDDKSIIILSGSKSSGSIPKIV